jgi:hypothetical protein
MLSLFGRVSKPNMFTVYFQILCSCSAESPSGVQRGSDTTYGPLLLAGLFRPRVRSVLPINLQHYRQRHL